MTADGPTAEALPELIEIQQARRLVLERSSANDAERILLAEALGRVLSDDASATEPVPAFDNSAMDGFAVRAVDTHEATPQSPAVLRIVAESRAGLPALSTSLGSGEAVRISTGAMLPDGADAVVRLEDARACEERLEVLSAAAPGRDVRRAGEDVQQGARVVSRGTVLGPAELGVLASLGRTEVACARRPTVAVLTTGDELQEPREQYRPGGVRNSNAYSIPALVERAGGELVMRETVSDDAKSTREAIAAAFGCDVLVVCGGVSVGEHDYVRRVLASLDVEQVFWGIALRPGRPTWFGVAPGGALVFGLPGNPVSAMVTFLLLARPAIRAMLRTTPVRDRAKAVLDEDYPKRPGRAHAVRCRLELRDDAWHARPTGEQGSHILTSMLGADALAMIPTASSGVRAGTLVDIELLPRG
jgi:molybdopterin molybdotransferase